MTSIVRAVAFLVGLLPDRLVVALARFAFLRTGLDLRRAVQDVAGAQRERLLDIVRRNAGTEFGRAHGFVSITDVEGFRGAVPLQTWDDVAPHVDRMLAGERGVLVAEDVSFYATTSGTTGRRKLVPAPPSFVAECRAQNKLLFRATLLEMPGLVRGKRLSMRSPGTEPVGTAGARAGSITVALGGRTERGESAFDAVPADVFDVADFATRYYLAVRFALQERTTLASAVNPSTLHLFAQTLATRADELARSLDEGTLAGVSDALVLGDDVRTRLAARARRDPAAAARVRASALAHGAARMRDALPALVGLVCWKGGASPWWLGRLKKSWGDLPVLDYGYAASEGCFGAPVSVRTAESVLVPHGHFFELAPVEDPAHPVLLHEAVVGRQYLVVVTTSGGLYRYQMNDVVLVTGKLGQAPLVVFQHKGGAVSSVTGEKLTESHAVQAMADAAASTSLPVDGFALAPLLPAEGAPRYALAVDGLDDGEAARLADAFDAALRRANLEYDVKRGSLRLDAVTPVVLPRGAFTAVRRRRVEAGAPDAHVKVPHVSPDGRLLVDLGVGEDVAALLPCRVGSASASAGASVPAPSSTVVSS